MSLPLVLLHVWHPAKRPADQEATWAALEPLRHGVGVSVVDYPTFGEDGYWRALELVWDHPGDVVVVEQDIVPTWDQVRELAECKEPYCAFDNVLGNGVAWSELPDGHSFGLAKLSARARGDIFARPQVPHLAWPDTVPATHERLAPVHVHEPPVEHHHYKGG